jgi:hypothetical protein
VNKVEVSGRSGNVDAEIVSALNVKTISEDPLIAEIFLYHYWEASEGLLFLTGIFQEYQDGDDSRYLRTLENRIFSSRSDKQIYDAFMMRHAKLQRIWNHEYRNRKYDKYTISFFVEWARRYPNECDLTWLEDAKTKGLIDFDEKVENPDETIGTKERTTLLVIIAALAKELELDMSTTSTTAEKIVTYTEFLGAPVSRRTIENHLQTIDDAIERRRK